MCNNYPNCNCPSCTQCQDCTQVTPTCNCTTTCTCSTEQFTEKCPSGLQSTNCLIYTGDNLQDCAGDDYIFRGTNFNTFLSQLWETVKCAATPSTDTIDYTGANILDCNGDILVPTNTPVTEALNSIWEEVKCPVIPKATDLIIEDLALTDCDNNDVLVGDYTVFDTITSVWEYVKCWYNDLSDLISERQPVWQGSATITIGASQPAPFNNINTAIVELSKYHFNDSDIILKLETGTYTVSNQYQFGKLLLDKNVLYVESLSGVKEDVIIKGSATEGVHGFSAGFIAFKNLTLASENNAPIIGAYASGAHTTLTNVKITNNASSSTLFSISDGASLRLQNCTFVDSNTSNTTTFISNKNNGTINVIGGTFTINRPFIINSDSSSLTLTNTKINFTNPAVLNVFTNLNNSSITVNNSIIENTNPSAFNSNAFVSENSTVGCVYDYLNDTNVIIGFYVGFTNIGSNVSVYGKGRFPIFYVKFLASNLYNSTINFNACTVYSYDYNSYSHGVYNLQSTANINNCSFECARVYTGVMGSNARFFGNTLTYNNTFYTINPSSSQLMFWEDGANSSTYSGNIFNFSNTSTGLRTSVNSTQFWLDNSSNPSSINTFINQAPSTALNIDFSSVVYKGFMTGITTTAINNSVVY